MVHSFAFADVTMVFLYGWHGKLQNYLQLNGVCSCHSRTQDRENRKKEQT